MTGGPQRMLFAAVAIRIAFGGNVLSGGTLAFLERIRTGVMIFAFLEGSILRGFSRTHPRVMRSCGARP